MQSYVRCVLMGCAMLAATVVAASPGTRHEAAGVFGSNVDPRGNIRFPVDFPRAYQHIGTWAVLGAEGVADTHVVYARPKDIAFYRKNGSFPDGAILIKEVLEALGSGHTTGKAFWGSTGKTWFVMVKEAKGRFPGHPLWGDGWGWAQFDPRDRSRQIATNYKSDCLQCHIPAKASDWVYVYAYPALGEKALRFTPEAARGSHLAAGDGHRVDAESLKSDASPAAEAQRKLMMGKRLFDNTCSACHAVLPGQHGTGPSLFGVVGRATGSSPGFDYSEAMRNAGLTWSVENIVKHLADTRGFIPGNRMGNFFKGVPAADERDLIAAYLATLK